MERRRGGKEEGRKGGGEERKREEKERREERRGRKMEGRRDEGVGERTDRREVTSEIYPTRLIPFTEPWNPLLQFLFQPDTCLKIEVVGWFVQEQESWSDK